MRSLPAHLHALFLTLWGVLWFFSPPAAADHWPARKYDAGRSGASNDILPEKLVRIWEYDFHLQLEEEPSAEDAEPPPQKTPEELRDAITHSNLFFEETERSLPRTNTEIGRAHV